MTTKHVLPATQFKIKLKAFVVSNPEPFIQVHDEKYCEDRLSLP